MNKRRAALVVYTPKKEVLICHPLGYSTHPGKWDLPKGHAEEGEDLATAALRECGEETGLKFESADLSDHSVTVTYIGDTMTVFFVGQPVDIDIGKLKCFSLIGKDCKQKWKVGLPEIDKYELVPYQNLSDWLFSSYCDDFYDFVLDFFESCSM